MCATELSELKRLYRDNPATCDLMMTIMLRTDSLDPWAKHRLMELFNPIMRFHGDYDVSMHPTSTGEGK